MLDVAMLDFARSRRQMVDCQLRTFDVTDKMVLAAMDEVPREAFVDAALAPIAYTDKALTVRGGTATLLAPMILGRLIQGLDVKPGQKALAAATVTGYGAAVLAHMGADVVALEDRDDLAAAARQALGQIGAAGIEVVTGPISGGWKAKAPYDLILLECGFVTPPQGLLDQLRDGGQLAGIDMSGGAGKAVLYTRTSAGFGRRMLFDAAAPVRQDLVPAPVFQF